jgi:prophage antirepressor-like protein
MTTEMMPFSYGDQAVRVVMIDGEPWFVLADLCAVLGLSQPHRVADRIADDMKGRHPITTPGGTQEMTIVSESGMYEVVIRSDKPEAVTFRRWITGIVLPEIRKTGSYAAAPLAGPELMAAGYIEAMKTIEARDARIHQLETARATDAPKVSYVDTYVTDADLLSFSTVASTNDIKESELRDLLIRKDWIYRQEESRWSNTKGQKEIRYRYTEKADKKRYFRRVEVHEAPRFRGEVMHTLKVTPAGAEAIARLITKEVAA